MTQCKFTCQSVTKRKHWDQGEKRFLYEAELTAVSSGSEENKKFFASEFGTFSKDAADLLLETGVIKKIPDLSKLADTRFLQ